VMSPLHGAGVMLHRTARTGRLALQAPRFFLGSLGLAEWARSLVERADVRLISAYHLFSAGLVGSWLSQELGLPLVTTIFGEIYENPDLYRKRLDAVQQIVSQSKLLLSCSHHCAGSLRLLGLSHPVETVYYGVDTQRFSPQRDGARIRQRLSIPPDRPIVLYLARMNRLMGLHVVLAAIPEVVAAHPGVVFLIAGSNGELTSRAREAEARWPDHVRVVPDVPGEELPLFYAAAAVVTVPSINRRACLGLSIEEALASGKPVVVSNVGGGPEIVSHEGIGKLVPPADPAALAAGVSSFLSDRAGRDRVSTKGRDLVLERFDKDLTNRTIEARFLDLLR
jgi:glycosyltransferase involved in cell wall biosynthesis